MMFSSLELPDDLYENLQAAAVRERRTVDSEIVCLLERALAAETKVPGAIVVPAVSEPGGSVLVITELADLRGPARGKIVLPGHLYPSEAVFDLDVPFLLQEAYQAVLAGAGGAWDLAAWLNPARLVEAWPGLYLTGEVRQAWEDIHPVLAAAQDVAGDAAR